jgi:hypothetical protein
MKTLVLIFSMVICAKTIFGVMALPPTAAGTNNWALQAGQLREVSLRSFQSGELQQLQKEQKEVSMIQCEQLFPAIAVGAAAGACLLTIRRVHNASRVQEDQTKETSAKK